MPAATRATRKLAWHLGREAEVRDFLERADAVFADCRARLRRVAPVAVAVINFVDARHLRIYGGPGLYQGVMDRIGLCNAWPGAENY